MTNIEPIVNLYRQFDRYKNNSDDELISRIYPSLKLNQYKIYKENGKIYGFCNWAFLGKTQENHLLITGEVMPIKWDSGNNYWLIDIVANKNFKEIAKWTKNYAVNILGVNKKIKILKVCNDKITYKEIITTEDFKHGVL